MANIPPPVVRYFIPCEDVLSHPTNPLKHTLVNIISNVKSGTEPPFPFTLEEMCIYLQLTECRGTGPIGFDIIHAETEAIAFPKREWTVKFNKNPLDIKGCVFRIHNITFQETGLHWLRLWFNNQQLDQRPINVKVQNE